MNRICVLSLIIFAAIALPVVTVATNAQAQINVGPGTINGSVQIGGFAQPVPYTNVAKSREYHDMAQQIIVPELKAWFGDKNERYFANFYALNLSQTNRIFNLHAGIYGLLDIQAQWLEIPHFYSDDVAASPYNRDGGNFTLPSRPAAPMPGQPTGENVGQWVNHTARPLSLSLLEGISNLHISYTPTPYWTYTLYFNYQNPTGERAFGELFGPNPGTYNITELFEPISYHTYNYGAGIEYANGTWSLGFRYDGSFFRNDYQVLTWQNPDVWGELGPSGACADSATYSPGAGTGPCQGRTSTYPDNEAHNFTLNGGLSLPYNTHAIASVSYGWWLQDSSFIPFTINSALPSQPLPRSSLGGDVTPFFGNFTLVSNPLQPLELKAVYSYFDYANHTPTIVFTNVQSLNDVSSPWTGTANPFSYSDQNVELAASYKITPALAARFVSNIKTIHNSGLMVLQQNQTSYGPILDWTPYDWLLFRGSYQHGFRDSPGYDNNRATLVSQNAGSTELEALRRFDEASVEINDFSLSAQAQPFNRAETSEQTTQSWLKPLTMYAEMDYDAYNYTASDIGLQYWSDYSPSAGISYDLGKGLRLYADYGWQATDFGLRSFQRQTSACGPPTSQTPSNCPAQVWTSVGRQQGSSVDFGIRARIPSNVILRKASRVSIRYTYTVTTDSNHSHGDATLGPAVSFPDIGTQFHELIVQYEYPITQKAALDLGFYFSHFGENNFAYDQLQPWMGSASPNSIFLGDSTWTPYNTTVGYITLQYHL